MVVLGMFVFRMLYGSRKIGCAMQLDSLAGTSRAIVMRGEDDYRANSNVNVVIKHIKIKNRTNKISPDYP